MENQYFGFEVTAGYKKMSTSNNKEIPHCLMDEIDGFALFILDQGGQISQWSQGAFRLTGYSTEEIIGRHYSCLFESQGMQIYKMPALGLDVAALQGIYENEVWWTRRDKSHFVAQIQIIHIVNNGGGYMVMVWDISNIKSTGAVPEENPRSLAM